MQNLQGQGILQLSLNGSLEGAGAVDGIIAFLGQEPPGCLGQFQPDVPFGQQRPQPTQLDVHDLHQILHGQGVEDDDLVYAVQEFRAEVAVQLLQHPLLGCLRPQLLDPVATYIGGHDDHGVLEVDRPPVAVGQAPVVQDLEQEVEDFRMGLLDLVEEDHAVGATPHRLSQLATFLVTHIAGRRTNHTGHRVALLVLAHVQADHGLLVIEEELSQGPAQLGLAHARGAQEDEATDGPVGILQASTGTAYRVSDGGYGFVLPHHAVVQALLYMEQFLDLPFHQAGNGDAGPTGDHLGYVLGLHFFLEHAVILL